MKKYTFTKEEKRQIEEAVASLEKESCGEIVPFFARKSDEYSEVSWQIAALLGLSSMAILAFLSYAWLLPPISYLESFVLISLIMLVGYFLPLLFPALRRSMISEEKAREMVALRAKEAFLNEKVYQTIEHVGILIYISRLEHMVLVLGDEGINKKVQKEDWEQVISLIIEGLKQKTIGAGLVNGINHCTTLLIQHGFVRKDADTNELSNELRVKE